MTETTSLTETDILVVGGGPAGVISALTAAKKGNRVMLVDAKSYEEIGNKTCGDAVNLGPLNFLKENLGLEMPSGEEVADTVESMVFETKNVAYPMYGDGFVLNRHPYGQRLLKEAEEYGVEVRSNTKAVRALTLNGTVVGVVVKENRAKEYEIRAKITIDCSGRNFQIRKSLSDSEFPLLEKNMEKRDIAASYREIIQLKDDHPYGNKIVLQFRNEIPEPGYFWIFSKGPKRLNLGIGWYLDTQVEKGMKELFWEVLHKYYPSGTYEVEDAGGYTIPARYPLLNAVASGFITAGDAAFHVNPLTAEGHGSALVAGYFAGLTAAEAIESSDLSQMGLWQYNERIMKHFGLSHAKIQLFTEALNTVKVSGLEFVLKRNILTQDQFVGLYGGKSMGAIELIKILIKIFPRYNLLNVLYRISRGANYFEKLFDRYPSTPEDYLPWKAEFDKKMQEIRQAH
ncbi:MAG: NAD(P)/FAD-dependent oxidoreductase [Candidatus Heimdallarchaeota archaeon]|nr:NAD(P)/FAD-dependent oxidoreductase [Candidatus Heimdallarchaeota archaeon]